MNNLRKFFAAIVIALAVFSQNDAIAQYTNIGTVPYMHDDGPYISPSSDGNYYVPVGTFNQSISLYACNATYSSALTYKQDIMRRDFFLSRKGQKWVLTMLLMVFPGIDTLDVSITLNNLTGPSGQHGNIQLTSDAAGTHVFKTLSLRMSENDADSMVINTADGTWTPARYGIPSNYLSGYFMKQWSYTLDSIPRSLCDTTGVYGQVPGIGLFYIQERFSVWANKYPRKSPTSSGPFIAPYYDDGVYSFIKTVDFTGYASIGQYSTKKVDAYFNDTTMKPGYRSFGSPIIWPAPNQIDLQVGYFPTNYYDSANCTHLSVELYDSMAHQVVSTNTWSPYWDGVDMENTGQSRVDNIFRDITFSNLKDTTLYVLRYKLGNQLTYSRTIWTLRAPAVAPVFGSLTLKSTTTSSVTATVKFTRGTTDTTPITLRLRDVNGAVMPDFTVSVVGSGAASIDITRINLLSFKDYSITAYRGSVLLQTINFRTVGVDALIAASSLQSTSVDVTPAVPVYALSYTAGSIDAPATARFIVTVTGPSGQVAQYDKSTTADQMTSQQMLVPLDFGIVLNTDYTVSVQQVSYPDAVNLSTKALGSFTIRKSSSGISVANSQSLSAYVDGSGQLQISGVQEHTVKALYDLSGSQVVQFTGTTLDMHSYPTGIYFLQVGDDHVLKVIKP